MNSPHISDSMKTSHELIRQESHLKTPEKGDCDNGRLLITRVSLLVDA